MAGGFERFWESYPRRVCKQDAIKAWNKLSPDVEIVVAGIEKWKSSWREPRFIPYPATFLRRRQWEESPEGEDSIDEILRRGSQLAHQGLGRPVRKDS